jgi:uncharacterized membrane protein YadS
VPADERQPMPGFALHWPGILLAVVVAIASMFIAEFRGGLTLLYALLLGVVLNSVIVNSPAKPGIDFAARRILRLGVALLGARITLEELSTLGWYNAGLIVPGVLATIAFGLLMSRVLGLDRNLRILTGGHGSLIPSRFRVDLSHNLLSLH